MKILFLAHYYLPHVGGVERHIEEISRILRTRQHEITVVTEKYADNLKGNEVRDNIKIIRFSYPRIKLIGLLYIWLFLFKNRNLIKQSDVVHVHDVFIWYLPFKFIFSKKKIYTTFHGWEGVYPVPIKNILMKQLAARLSTGTIAVGRYIGKYYGIKVDKIVYGGVECLVNLGQNGPRQSNSVVFLGRLEQDTGVTEFISWLRGSGEEYKVDFVGDGTFRKQCEKYGKVHGFCNPKPFLRKAEICVPGGYLAFFEAKASGCKIMTFADNPLKKDYWRDIKRLKSVPLWEDVAKDYEDLYLHNNT